MQQIFFTLILMTATNMAWAAPLPLLGRVIGGVGENGETLPGASKRCFIYPNQAVVQTIDGVTGRTDTYAVPLNLTAAYLEQVSAALLNAEKARETGAPHAVETVPHLYYFGYATKPDGTQTSRIRLFFEGKRRIEREGRETPQILQVTEHLCPHR